MNGPSSRPEADLIDGSEATTDAITTEEFAGYQLFKSAGLRLLPSRGECRRQHVPAARNISSA